MCFVYSTSFLYTWFVLLRRRNACSGIRTTVCMAFKTCTLSFCSTEWRVVRPSLPQQYKGIYIPSVSHWATQEPADVILVGPVGISTPIFDQSRKWRLRGLVRLSRLIRLFNEGITWAFYSGTKELLGVVQDNYQRAHNGLVFCWEKATGKWVMRLSLEWDAKRLKLMWTKVQKAGEWSKEDQGRKQDNWQREIQLECPMQEVPFSKLALVTWYTCTVVPLSIIGQEVVDCGWGAYVEVYPAWS